MCENFYMKACSGYVIPFTVSLVSAVLAARG